jgi:hypothetical protein
MIVYPSEIVTKSIEVGTFGTEQVFGVPFPVKDSENIEVYTGLIKNKQTNTKR